MYRKVAFLSLNCYTVAGFYKAVSVNCFCFYIFINLYLQFGRNLKQGNEIPKDQPVDGNFMLLFGNQ